MHRIERRGRVAVVRMEHGKANALDSAFCRGMGELFRGFEADPAAAFVLTGTGGIFSAGVDLVRLRDGGPSGASAFTADLEFLYGALAKVPKPVVAAVNGHAVAGGCILVQGCDWRVMAEGKGTIGVPELRVGVPFPPVVFELMRAAVAPPVLRSLVYLGGTRGPADALAAGLVDEVCPAGTLLDRAVEVAERLASVPPVSFAIAKRQLLERVLRTVDGSEPVGSKEIAAAWADPAVQASIREFVRKTLER
jgi:enoyl-CoA hydratase/carnithine racemase